ncbi:unnamed protein product [Rotaria sordida]|uniref:SCP domain-containing protein n=1 Tax=Rotaria sordida TaxID=392033 RepID=A0A818W684_9BILA|nr:unnamed protein product [Rotaria sordida]CAF0854270.1 unnamed protein product [Rotaria sordida]CAF0860326.1 unnamed protein product [Rotaria sordida]CAF3647647.1 unnamed protein product [Rotaria sordida]CAF3721240.1 unnamed protein product [Rotaria sordida]
MGCNNSTATVESRQMESIDTDQESSAPLSRTQKRADAMPNTWRMQALNAHNAFRARHGVPPLVLKDEITHKAQAYAEYLAENNLFNHSSNRDNLGENLYTMSSSEPLTNESLGTDATQSWYDEIKSYDFSNPGFSMETGHFTQVIWKNTNSLGVGVAFDNSGRRAIVVAQYGPAGNVMEQFPENVPPPQ